MIETIIVSYLYLLGYINTLFCWMYPSNISVLYYIALLLFAMILFCINRTKVNYMLIQFYLFYLVIIFVNAIIVPYKKFVLVEGLSSVIISWVPFYCISSFDMNLEKFLKRWRQIAIISSCFLFIVIFLYKYKLIHYGIFALFTVPSVLIFTWYYCNSNSYKGTNFLFILLNIFVTFSFGGRMAFLAELIIFIFSYLVFTKKSFKKIFVCLSTLIVGIISFYFMPVYLSFIRSILNSWGLSSRTLNLLIEQISSGALFKGMYYSHRDYIYSIAWDYITRHNGLPGGFAVIRHLTNDTYYIAHNMFLELSVAWGILGCITFLAFVIFRYTNYYKKYSNYDFRFIFMLGIFYFIYSFTGQSIFSSPYAMVTIALLFFRKKRVHIFTIK